MEIELVRSPIEDLPPTAILRGPETRVSCAAVANQRLP